MNEEKRKKEGERVIDEFTQQNLPEIIKSLDAKSPAAERFLLEIARIAGLKQAELFNGHTVMLGADESEDVVLNAPPDVV